jgi:hypothetical protein
VEIPALGNVAMSKKKKQTSVPFTGRFLARLESVTKWIHENQNWVYIAIIGFCLSVTILYKISQGYGA